MPRTDELEAAAEVSRPAREVRVSLLIRTHALPPLSYRIPDHLLGEVGLGCAVIVPLSGYSRLGIVVGVGDAGRSSEPVRGVVRDLCLSPGLVEVCCRVSEAAAMPLSSVLGAALPQKLETNRYLVTDPAPGWPWDVGSRVSRTTLKRHLGGEGLRAAEDEDRVRLDAGPPERKPVEWAVLRRGARPDLTRAPRQRELWERLSDAGGELPVRELLAATGSSRSIVRALVERGAVKLERRPPSPPHLKTLGIRRSAGPSSQARDLSRDAGRIVDRGGAWLWRMPSSDQPVAVAAIAAAAVEGGEQALVLVPEIKVAERLARYVCEVLPRGHTVATYHSDHDPHRPGIYQMAREGRADVVVGTRPAALLPLPRLGAICVVDEPNEAHRARPGYEGLRVHVREVALAREEAEGPGVALISSTPSLRVYARKGRGIRELAGQPARSWPAARIIDLRGSGAVLSEELVDACRRGLDVGGRVALISNRLGYATSVSCNRCGSVQTCPDCDLPLALLEATGCAACGRCGYRSLVASKCAVCGSGRMSPTGLGVERLRNEIVQALDTPVGLLTAARRVLEDAPVVVGTAHCVVEKSWHAVAVADVDNLLLGASISSVERAFRMLYAAAESADELVAVQTRVPEHHALQTALRGDYPAFAAAELPRLRALGYPPFGHLASLTFWGGEEAVRGAVESSVRPSLEPGVTVSEPVPAAQPGGEPVWRTLLRSSDRGAVTRSATTAVRLVVRQWARRKLRVQVEIDPEEV